MNLTLRTLLALVLAGCSSSAAPSAPPPSHVDFCTDIYGYACYLPDADSLTDFGCCPPLSCQANGFQMAPDGGKGAPPNGFPRCN